MEQDKQNNDNLGSDDINSFNSDAASSMFDDSIQAGGSMFDGPNQGDDSTSMFGFK